MGMGVGGGGRDGKKEDLKKKAAAKEKSRILSKMQKEKEKGAVDPTVVGGDLVDRGVFV